jgi:hypothetical protein
MGRTVAIAATRDQRRTDPPGELAMKPAFKLAFKPMRGQAIAPDLVPNLAPNLGPGRGPLGAQTRMIVRAIAALNRPPAGGPSP